MLGAWEGICHILGLTSDQSIQDTEDTDTNTAHWETAHPLRTSLQTSVFNFVFYSALPLYDMRVEKCHLDPTNMEEENDLKPFGLLTFVRQFKTDN